MSTLESTPGLPQTQFVTPAESAKLKRAIVRGTLSNLERVQNWFQARSEQAPPPFYGSVDIRDSGVKIAPVDNNLFPGGFNNLCPDDLRTAPPIIRRQLETKAAAFGQTNVKRVLIIPESHTQNRFYAENLATLVDLLRQAGFETEVGWYSNDLAQTDAVVLESVSGRKLTAQPLKILGQRLSTAAGFTPDLILINNDFSSGYPKTLDQVEQPIIPSHALGWHTRKKSEHFIYYNELAAEFSEIIGIDPWSIQVDTQEVDAVNFSDSTGIDQVRETTRAMLERLHTQYDARGIKNRPFVFVKNNSGTYGMGILVVHDVAELDQLNRREKNKMSVGKNRLAIQSVVVQEGIPTATLVDRLPAEPVIYLVGCELVGGFLRTNSERTIEDNLNSQGMVFRKLCMADFRSFDPSGAFNSDAELDAQALKSAPQLEIVYGSIARLSALATGRELVAHGITPDRSHV